MSYYKKLMKVADTSPQNSHDFCNGLRSAACTTGMEADDEVAELRALLREALIYVPRTNPTCSDLAARIAATLKDTP